MAMKSIVKLPSIRFRRNIGIWANLTFNTNGNLLPVDTYNRLLSSWLPSETDKNFINSLMVQELNPGKTASWITKPKKRYK